MRTCLHLFKKRSLDEGIRITKYMLEHEHELPIKTQFVSRHGSNERKDIRLYVFLHPSRREVFEKKDARLRAIRKRQIDDCQSHRPRG